MGERRYILNRFYISDTHFGHSNILGFKRADGTPLRQFCCVESMNEHMIQQWNSVVKAGDTVYHLGDVALHAKFLPIFLPRLNGRKILIKGNHDTAKLSEYAKYFADVRAIDRKEGFVLSHVPIHPSSLDRWGINVHGHLHDRRVQTDTAHAFKNDPRYFCVAVEQINYTPIEEGELRKRIKYGS